jgi:hypothetical protein
MQIVGEAEVTIRTREKGRRLARLLAERGYRLTKENILPLYIFDRTEARRCQLRRTKAE